MNYDDLRREGELLYAAERVEHWRVGGVTFLCVFSGDRFGEQVEVRNEAMDELYIGRLTTGRGKLTGEG
jgi:hypothetical protein